MNSVLNTQITLLADYAIAKDLIGPEDRLYVINRLLALFGESEYEAPDDTSDLIRRDAAEIDLPQVLGALTDIAQEKGLLKSEGITGRDLFDTEIMGVLTPRPSETARTFRALYAQSPEKATDWFYGFSGDVNYIRRDRIAKDRRWKYDSDYGRIDITINLSKPEKDPRDIAAAKTVKKISYPKCQLCMENEGYAGRLDHPARANHRIIPVSLCGAPFGFQYSPYVYYNEHCIVLNRQHIPMKIDRDTFARLLDFVRQFPHYFLGSNADLPIVGGSILTHDHFQGGRYEFAMARAPYERMVTFPGYEDVEAGIVHWPMSVIRLRSARTDDLTDLADRILTVWRGYTDEAAMIYAGTDGEPHNTITPIARQRDGVFELDLVLRNNLTTAEYPMGIYHPHEALHHIKKENIGLIEVMGLAVLPARLKDEMALLAQCLVEGTDPAAHESLVKHAAWAAEISAAHPQLNAENVDGILQEEIGKVFVQVLEDAGVYKCTPEGREAFSRFLTAVELHL